MLHSKLLFAYSKHTVTEKVVLHFIKYLSFIWASNIFEILSKILWDNNFGAFVCNSILIPTWRCTLWKLRFFSWESQKKTANFFCLHSISAIYEHKSRNYYKALCFKLENKSFGYSTVHNPTPVENVKSKLVETVLNVNFLFANSKHTAKVKVVSYFKSDPN